MKTRAKKFYKNLLRSLKTDYKNSKTRLLVFIFLFALIGVTGTFLIFADMPSFNTEADRGTPSGNVSKINDPLASGGTALQFGGSKGGIYPPDTIKYDCSEDVAASLNAWLASLPNGTAVALRPNGCYRAESAIVLTDKQWFTINGNNATLKRTTYNGANAPPGNYRHLHLAGGGVIVIRDLNILGQKNPAGGYVVAVEGQMGIGIYGSVAVNIDNVNIQHVHGDFVYITYRGAKNTAQAITIQNSYFRDAGRQGIAIIDVDGATIRNNDIRGTGRSTIDLEPAGAEKSDIDNVTIDNNTFADGGSNFISNEGGGGGLKNLVVSNNNLIRPMTIVIDPPKAFRRGPVTIINNRGTNPGKTPFEIHGVDGLVIKGNRLAVALNDQGLPAKGLVNIYGSTNVQVMDNITTGAAFTMQALGQISTGYCEKNNIPMSIGIPICP